MREKFMKQKRYLVLGLFAFMVSFMAVTTSKTVARADKGDLQINNQVIYEQEGGSLGNTATFTINQLFLPDMSTQEKQVAKKQAQVVSAAQAEVFTQETPQVESIDKKVTPQLFSKEYTMAEEGSSEKTNQTNQSKIGIILLCIIGGLLVAFLGIFLGRMFPRLLKST